MLQQNGLERVHIYRANDQPATRFFDVNVGPHGRWFRCRRRRMWRTDCCGKRRWAAHVRVQVYYDHIHRFCADGRGCQQRKVK